MDGQLTNSRGLHNQFYPMCVIDLKDYGNSFEKYYNCLPKNIKRDERVKILGEEQSKDLEKRIFLQLIDQNWKTHIQYLEQLRQVIGLRSYGQRDPLIEYKKEAFNLFEDLLNKLKTQFIGLLLSIKIVTDNQKEEVNSEKSNNPKCLLVIKKGEKIPRNEICPATSKKYKNCCGAL